MKHPEMCLSRDSNNNCILIKWGVSGYYGTNYPNGEYDDDIINGLNARRGITPQMREAMEYCSIAAQNKPDLDWEKHYQMCMEMQNTK